MSNGEQQDISRPQERRAESEHTIDSDDGWRADSDITGGVFLAARREFRPQPSTIWDELRDQQAQKEPFVAGYNCIKSSMVFMQF